VQGLSPDGSYYYCDACEAEWDKQAGKNVSTTLHISEGGGPDAEKGKRESASPAARYSMEGARTPDTAVTLVACKRNELVTLNRHKNRQKPAH
jgi:hypothetical protein